MYYALIKGTTVENCIVADAAFAATLTGYDAVVEIPVNQPVGPGWGWNGVAGFIPPPESPPVQLARTLTHKAFRDRLSFDEQVLLDNFTVAEYAGVEPKIQSLTVIQRAQVRTAIATYRESQEIDLDDPATVRFVALIGELGLLDGPERAEAILGEG